jgi:hypothetical protein
MAAVTINPKHILPLPQELWESNCAKCDKPQSRWEFKAADVPVSQAGNMMCSLCWLYESQWGKSRSDDIDQLINDVETEKGNLFARDARKRLLRATDGDSILSAVALTSRMLYMQQKTRR